MMQKEHILQSQIIVELCRRGCHAENHTVGIFYTNEFKRIKVGNPGESDIYGVRPDGRAFFIEVKLPGENPRQNQKDFLIAMKQKNALCGVARSVEDAIRIVFESEDL